MSQFEEGDRVVIQGRRATVEEVDNADMSLWVRWENGTTDWVDQEEAKRVVVS